jgi:hypothetical protein
MPDVSSYDDRPVGSVGPRDARASLEAVTLVVAVLLAGCTPPASHGAVTAPPATVAIASPTSAGSSVTPRSSPAAIRPPERLFTRGHDIVVGKAAPAPPKRFIVKEAKFMGASRDAKSFVAETLRGNLLITQQNPGGAKLDDGVLVEPGAFTADGAFVAVFYQGGLEVYRRPPGARSSATRPRTRARSGGSTTTCCSRRR